MKTHAIHAVTLLLGATLTAGPTLAGATPSSADYGKPAAFVDQATRAQLGHVRRTAEPAGSAARRSAPDQAFGAAGGVLNDIWQSHYRGWAARIAQSYGSAPRAPGQRGFLADVRRSHFGHLDV